jgi:transketolase
LPNCVVIEPCNAVETKAALEWCVEEAKENCMIRLAMSPSPGTIRLPENYKFEFSRGSVLREGSDAVIFGYGPVMLHEALLAGGLLEKDGISLKVVNMPWLNMVDQDWLDNTVGSIKQVFVLDNHFPRGGLGDLIVNVMMQSDKLKDKYFKKFAIEGYPACGTPQEALKYHGLDGMSMAERILKTKDMYGLIHTL